MNHYQEAEQLLARAAGYVDTPKVGVAKTLATMASAHSALALTKATRQAAADVELVSTVEAVIDSLERWNGDDGSLVVTANIRHLRRALLNARPPDADGGDQT